PPPPTSTLFPYTTLFRSWSNPTPAVSYSMAPTWCRLQHALKSFAPKACKWCFRILIPHSIHGGGSPVSLPRRWRLAAVRQAGTRSEEHTSELQSPYDLVC